MTNNNFDEWFDDIVDGNPKLAENWQLNYIEGIINYTSISNREKEDIINNLNELSEIEADKILKYLKENETHKDPKHQYEQMRKNGVFTDRNS